ncbi:MAG: TatD family hydrolase [Proteobacteria bacterium]|jgi:TatD DNase family protein|nr:TatD family hydrolase [Pseudomonadota bacterium]
MFIDTHAHLNFPDFASDLPAVLERSRKQGVTRMIVVGAGKGMEGNPEAVELARGTPGIFATVGLHPHEAREFSPAALSELRALLQAPRVVAVGECGLDFYRNLSPRREQFRAFEAQLELALQTGRPVSIHCREAHPETLEVLKRARSGGLRGVIHCFSGGMPEAREYVELNFWLGITGAVTYPRSEKLRGVIREMGLSRLLLETDCPFLTPQPKRGTRNEPAYIPWVAEEIGRILSVPVEEVARVTTENANRLFKLEE